MEWSFVTIALDLGRAIFRRLELLLLWLLLLEAMSLSSERCDTSSTAGGFLTLRLSASRGRLCFDIRLIVPISATRDGC